MPVPGSNLLNKALRVIAKQSFSYLRFLSNTPQDNGIDLPVYAPAITLTGSVQAVPQNMVVYYGLDTNKNYIMVYTSNNLMAIERDRSSDQIIFNSVKYQLISNTIWFPMDGWIAVICVQVPN